MKMETYISELLYRHDCVIVPGLGGFITNYRSAQIHPVSHTLRPPSKRIGFNVQLKDNDGLLANYIASCESISFGESLNKIEQFAKTIQNDLAHKKQATIEKVGTLSLDLEGKISFEPDTSTNYLLDSFGLDPIQSPAILRKPKVVSIPKQVTAGAKHIGKQKSRINWKVAAVIVPLIGLSAYVSFEQERVSEVYANYAYLNPFKEKPAAVYTPRTTKIRKEPTKELVLKATEAPVHAAKEVTPKAAKNVEATAISKNFHLVAGCFSSTENANKLIASLQAEGYNASIIGQNDQGLFRVAFESFGSRKQAIEAMSKIKAQGKSTWLLIK